VSADAGHGEVACELSDFVSDIFEFCGVLVVLQRLQYPAGHLFHFVGFHAAGGECGGSDAYPAGVHGFAGVVGDHVFIDGDAGVIEGVFSDFS